MDTAAAFTPNFPHTHKHARLAQFLCAGIFLFVAALGWWHYAAQDARLGTYIAQYEPTASVSRESLQLAIDHLQQNRLHILLLYTLFLPAAGVFIKLISRKADTSDTWKSSLFTWAWLWGTALFAAQLLYNSLWRAASVPTAVLGSLACAIAVTVLYFKNTPQPPPIFSPQRDRFLRALTTLLSIAFAGVLIEGFSFHFSESAFIQADIALIQHDGTQDVAFLKTYMDTRGESRQQTLLFYTIMVPLFLLCMQIAPRMVQRRKKPIRFLSKARTAYWGRPENIGESLRRWLTCEPRMTLWQLIFLLLLLLGSRLGDNMDDSLTTLEGMVLVSALLSSLGTLIWFFLWMRSTFLMPGEKA